MYHDVTDHTKEIILIFLLQESERQYQCPSVGVSFSPSPRKILLPKRKEDELPNDKIKSSSRI